MSRWPRSCPKSYPETPAARATPMHGRRGAGSEAELWARRPGLMSRAIKHGRRRRNGGVFITSVLAIGYDDSQERVSLFWNHSLTNSDLCVKLAVRVLYLSSARRERALPLAEKRLICGRCRSASSDIRCLCGRLTRSYRLLPGNKGGLG